MNSDLYMHAVKISCVKAHTQEAGGGAFPNRESDHSHTESHIHKRRHGAGEFTHKESTHTERRPEKERDRIERGNATENK